MENPEPDVGFLIPARHVSPDARLCEWRNRRVHPRPYYDVQAPRNDLAPEPAFRVRTVTFRTEYDYQYTRLKGWIAPVSGDVDAFRISISGTKPNDVPEGRDVPSRLHVWGVFPIDRTESKP